MIQAEHLTKRYGEKVAVDDLSFTIEPGLVTGFLGPNGAGKSTTMCLILGLDRPDSGTVTVDGQRCGAGGETSVRNEPNCSEPRTPDSDPEKIH